MDKQRYITYRNVKIAKPLQHLYSEMPSPSILWTNSGRVRSDLIHRSVSAINVVLCTVAVSKQGIAKIGQNPSPASRQLQRPSIEPASPYWVEVILRQGRSRPDVSKSMVCRNTRRPRTRCWAKRVLHQRAVMSSSKTSGTSH